MNTNSSALSPSASPARTFQSNLTAESRPNPEANAAQLKQFLLDLSKRDENKEFRGILRQASDRIREKAFGVNRAVVKRKIVNFLRTYELGEMDDFLDEIKVSKKEIVMALDELLKGGTIETGQRRRWQEPGKHFNTTYQLTGNK